MESEHGNRATRRVLDRYWYRTMAHVQGWYENAKEINLSNGDENGGHRNSSLEDTSGSSDGRLIGLGECFTFKDCEVWKIHDSSAQSLKIRRCKQPSGLHMANHEEHEVVIQETLCPLATALDCEQDEISGAYDMSSSKQLPFSKEHQGMNDTVTILRIG